MIEISDPARDHLVDLLGKQDDVIGVYITVDRPGTVFAKTLLSYYRDKSQQSYSKQIDFGSLKTYIDGDCEEYLKGTVIDFEEQELTVKSPNSKTPILPQNATLEEKVEFVLAVAVNPILAAHGGTACLIEVDNGVAVLEFGGGCQGCAVMPVTMKFAVEKQLVENIPEITTVRDITDHSVKDNAYYK